MFAPPPSPRVTVSPTKMASVIVKKNFAWHRKAEPFSKHGTTLDARLKTSLTQFFVISLIFLPHRIRKAGYPMRHTFKEFIDRYYMLSEGLARGQLDGQGLKSAAVKIAKGLLGNTDWQVGKTKIFLKVSNKDTCLFVCLFV